MPLSDQTTDATVGYKCPPVKDQFKGGQSGNPNGRPRGRPNIATLTKQLFNEPIYIREGGKRRRVPACEAIVRSLVAAASHGDHRALFNLLEIYKMTGRPNDVSDEERAKRAMHLSASFSMEEYDLLQSDARERERERYRMIAEMDADRHAASKDGRPTIVVSSDIKVGDAFASDHKVDQALAAYHREIAACKDALTADKDDKRAQENFRRAVARIGLVADDLLVAGKFARAIMVADDALTEGSTSFWVPKRMAFYENIIISSTSWIAVVRAHARMLAGRVEEARKFYLSINSSDREALTSRESSILRDFVRLRKAGYDHELMAEIEKHYADEGWTTGMGNTKRMRPTVNGADAVFIELHPDDIKAGDLQREAGKPDEAMEIYLRNLEKWTKNLANQPDRADWKHKVDLAVGRIVLAIQDKFRRGQFFMPVEYADRAIALAPDELLLHAVRACALMLHGKRDDDARTAFLRYCGSNVGDKSWETVISEQFAELRKIGCVRPMMEEIERRFAGVDVPDDAAVVSPSIQAKDIVSPLVQASDIQSGELLEERGMLAEALTVYDRCLQACNLKIAKFSNGQFNITVIDDRNAVIDKLENLAIRFLHDRQFAKALEAADCVLAAMPKLPRLNICRGHALMFLDGREEEAKAIYLRYRREPIEAKRIGEDLILQDFAWMREADLAHPLMDEIETLFTAPAQSRDNQMEKAHA